MSKRGPVPKVYEFIERDKVIARGTMKELVEQLHMRRESIMYYKSSKYLNREKPKYIALQEV